MPSNYGFIKVGPNLPLKHELANMDSLCLSRPRDHLWPVYELRERMTSNIGADFNSVKALIYQKWNEYLLFLGGHIAQVTGYMHRTYHQHVIERFRGWECGTT